MTSKQKELETLIEAVRIYSDDIGKEFGSEKYAILIMKSRKWQVIEGIELSNQGKTRTLGEKETYQYLGILAAEMKEKLERIPQENEKTTENQTT